METIKGSEIAAIGRRTYYKYYRVEKNDTLVKVFSTNDFKPAGPSGHCISQVIFLQDDSGSYFMCTDLRQAMEKAKAGAQAYIERLIAEGDSGLSKLLQYRVDHYEDLHINLVDANIQREEDEIHADKNFVYKPYRIESPVDNDPT